MMFEPTHVLVSRTRRVPVMVTTGGDKSAIYTQAEWEQNRTPAFELHSKLGIFCRGVQVIGHHLEPIEAGVTAEIALA
jgi:hypothetical protein